jgi:tetratricopeptide (TPR) repeat protein
VSVADVLNELLGHEQRFWYGTAKRLGLLAGTAGMTVATLRQIVAAGALLGAASQDEAVRLLKRVPGAVASVKVAAWLRDMYPPVAGPSEGGPAEWLGTLQPDRLAERLVVAQLAESPELARRCLTGLGERQALRATTLLGRAAADQPTASVLLEQVLPLLEQVVAELPADVGLLTAISDAIPYPSAALAEADLKLTRRVLQLLPPGNPELRARWLNRLGAALTQTGRQAEAMPPAQEAVDVYRELAATGPDRFRPDLATALSNISALFAALVRPADAVPPAREAVDVYRELAAADPDRYRPRLADSLHNLGDLFAALGRPAEALPSAQEVVLIGRELAAAKPDRFRPDLANSLNSLGLWFAAAGRLSEALPPAQEAVQIGRELAAADPRNRPHLATALSNLDTLFAALSRLSEALPLAQEVVQIRRELAVADPDRFGPHLADSLTSLSVRISALGRLSEALPPAQEAVQTGRELAAADPDRFRPYLANSLRVLALALDGVGRTLEASVTRNDADFDQ